MPLPVAPPPKSDDIAIHGWSGITVRVAWTILYSGIKLRPEVLDAARRHVLYHLPPSMPLPQAEDRAETLTRRFLATARHQLLHDPWPADAEMPLTDRWAQALASLKDRLTVTVFRRHYGDGQSIEKIAAALGTDTLTVTTTQEALREVLRELARADDLPLGAWGAERLDRVLRRLAAWAPDACPPSFDVVMGAHQDHVRTCVRCNRMVRLVKRGYLDAEALQAPTLRARPRGTLRLLLIDLHGEARPHRSALLDALPTPHHTIGKHLVAVEGSKIEQARKVLTIAAELGRPPRHLIRAVEVEADGAWSPFGPLGPALERAAHELVGRPWSTVDGLGTLPEPLPAPPSAMGAWLLTGGLCTAAVAALWLTLGPGPRPPPAERVHFVAGGDATWAQFDVPEETKVALVGAPGGSLEVVLTGKDAVEKAEYATGDGRYRARIPGPEALLVASPEPLELAPLVRRANRAPSPLEALHMELQRTYPEARIFAWTP